MHPIREQSGKHISRDEIPEGKTIGTVRSIDGKTT